MKKIVGLVISVAVLSGVVWTSVDPQKREQQITYDVTTYTVGQKASKDIDVYGAQVKNIDEAVVSAQVGGSLQDLVVREGERVHKGQVIARIDAGEYAAQYAQAQKGLLIAEEQEKLARRHWDDLKPEERVQYTLTSEKMRSAVAESGAYVKKSYILAPFDGMISSKFVSEGTTVVPGTSIVRIIGDMEKKEIVFDVPIDVGKNIAIDATIDVLHGDTIEQAVVYAIDPVADEQTRKITIRASLSDQSQMTVGEIVDVHIAVDMDEEGYVVPYATIVRAYDDTFVYVVRDDSVHMQSVDVVATLRDHAVIRGVQNGDVVVAHNAHVISDGDRVRVVAENE